MNSLVFLANFFSPKCLLTRSGLVNCEALLFSISPNVIFQESSNHEVSTTDQEDFLEDDSSTVASIFIPPESIAEDDQSIDVPKAELDDNSSDAPEFTPPESFAGDTSTRVYVAYPKPASCYKGFLPIVLMLFCIVMLVGMFQMEQYHSSSIVPLSTRIVSIVSFLVHVVPSVQIHAITATATATPPATLAPGHTYIIHALSSDKIITHSDDQVTLAPQSPRCRDSHNSYQQWLVVEIHGWLYLKNVNSGLVLGHDNWGKLRRTANHYKELEKFHVQPFDNGGYLLLMTHWDKLVQVGVRSDGYGNMVLAKLQDGRSYGIVWEFVKVEH
jgi:hypothetical protein